MAPCAQIPNLKLLVHELRGVAVAGEHEEPCQDGYASNGDNKPEERLDIRMLGKPRLRTLKPLHRSPSRSSATFPRTLDFGHLCRSCIGISFSSCLDGALDMQCFTSLFVSQLNPIAPKTNMIVFRLPPQMPKGSRRELGQT